MMDLDYSSKSSKSIKGIHGVKLVHQSSRGSHSEDFDVSTCSDIVKVERSPNLIFTQIWHQRPSFLRPIHCSIQGDQNIAETVANILTSVPFIILGLQAPRKNLNSVLYANSLIGVGVASSLYHSSRGQVRRLLRWADYTMIATATVCLSRALHSENPKLLTAASAMFLPFQPLMVSVVHAGMMEPPPSFLATREEYIREAPCDTSTSSKNMEYQEKNLLTYKEEGHADATETSEPALEEVKEEKEESVQAEEPPQHINEVEAPPETTGVLLVAFAKKALTKPELRSVHNLHTMSSVLGGILFVADDLFPGTPYIHAAWHLAAAVGVGTCHKLLE